MQIDDVLFDPEQGCAAFTAEQITSTRSWFGTACPGLFIRFLFLIRAFCQNSNGDLCDAVVVVR